MNDYIDRLIGRSQNKAQVIQPRLPAIFEPQTNDKQVLYKREVDIEPSYHSSKEDVRIAPLPQKDKQMSSADPVIKSIKTGKNDVTSPDKSELKEPAPSLNFAHAKTEYPKDFSDTIADNNVSKENVIQSHKISFEPDNKRAKNPDPIKPTNFIDRTIETESRPEGSISNKVSTEKSEAETPVNIKISDRFTSPHSSNNEINIQQHEENTNSRSDRRQDEKLTGNSNIENAGRPLSSSLSLSFSQKHSDPKKKLQNPHDSESDLAVASFKGKLVTGPGIEWNNRTSVVSNDNFDQQESVIRVNIGRIEVRAVTPSSPPPQYQSKQLKPLLSLDDYLSRRNGGSR